MNENEKPLSDFLLSPSKWDHKTKALVALNILLLLVIIVGFGIFIGALAGSSVPLVRAGN